MAKDDVFLALADFLIPAYQDKPKFSDVCTYEDARAALGFRHDLAEAFERALNLDVGEAPRLLWKSSTQRTTRASPRSPQS